MKEAWQPPEKKNEGKSFLFNAFQFCSVHFAKLGFGDSSFYSLKRVGDLFGLQPLNFSLLSFILLFIFGNQKISKL
jgi:hypothetical protein